MKQLTLITEVCGLVIGDRVMDADKIETYAEFLRARQLALPIHELILSLKPPAILHVALAPVDRVVASLDPGSEFSAQEFIRILESKGEITPAMDVIPEFKVDTAHFTHLEPETIASFLRQLEGQNANHVVVFAVPDRLDDLSNHAAGYENGFFNTFRGGGQIGTLTAESWEDMAAGKATAMGQVYNTGDIQTLRRGVARLAEMIQDETGSPVLSEWISRITNPLADRPRVAKEEAKSGTAETAPEIRRDERSI